MPERFARLVNAIQHLFEDMGVDAAEERVLNFILQEIHAGKTLEEALKEPYVANNTRPEWRREILERPEVVKAVEETVEKCFESPDGGGPCGD
ncbi:MAG: hypothetical protein WC935_00855 [Thermoleophilia bacterium]